MKQVEALAKEIRDYCKAHADPAQAARYTRYFKEGYDPWGIPDGHAYWKEEQAEWLERYSALGLRGFLRVGELLFAGGKYEEGALAIRFAKHYRDEFDPPALTLLAKWFRAGIGNWAHTDVLCGEILSPLLGSGRIPLEAFESWRQSSFKYQRRAVPVAMLGLLKEHRDPSANPDGYASGLRREADTTRLLDFLRPLMMDAERVVQQGLGWFLREAWKKHPLPVEAFLKKHKERSPRLIFQYATEKMAPEERAAFRREPKNHKVPKAKKTTKSAAS